MPLLLPATDLEMARRNWGWFVALGALLLFFGMAGLFIPLAFTVAAVLLIGWLFVVGGAMEVLHAVLRRGWSGFWPDFLGGLLTLAVGVLIVANPGPAIGVFTVVIGLLFVVGGLCRVGVGFALKGPYRGWLVLQGVVDVILGGVILAQYPGDAGWVIGTLVAIDLIFNGSRLIAFGSAARNLTPPAAAA